MSCGHISVREMPVRGMPITSHVATLPSTGPDKDETKDVLSTRSMYFLSVENARKTQTDLRPSFSHPGQRTTPRLDT
jgi:hypothetical protein